MANLLVYILRKWRYLGLQLLMLQIGLSSKNMRRVVHLIILARHAARGRPQMKGVRRLKRLLNVIMAHLQTKPHKFPWDFLVECGGDVMIEIAATRLRPSRRQLWAAFACAGKLSAARRLHRLFGELDDRMISSVLVNFGAKGLLWLQSLDVEKPPSCLDLSLTGDADVWQWAVENGAEIPYLADIDSVQLLEIVFKLRPASLCRRGLEHLAVRAFNESREDILDVLEAHNLPQMLDGDWMQWYLKSDNPHFMHHMQRLTRWFPQLGNVEKYREHLAYCLARPGVQDLSELAKYLPAAAAGKDERWKNECLEEYERAWKEAHSI